VFRRHGPGHVEGVVEAIPLQDGSASIVWSIATVHHWGDIDGGLREARRVLLPPRVVLSPSNGKRNLGQVVMPAMDGARTKPTPSWTDVVSMA
jgi:ubiquinone/menaquinone biosynthesis C-methylase UbiE